MVSEARRRTLEAVAWIGGANPETLFLSVIAVGEIVKGIVMKARTDPKTAASLQRWLDDLRVFYAIRLLPIDAAVATEWGRLMARRSRPVADALIGATARVNNKVLVTRNVPDFADMGLDIVNPWAV